MEPQTPVTPSPTPVTPSAMPPQQMPPAPAPLTSPQPPKSGKKGLMIGLLCVLLVIVLMVAGALAYVLVFSPAAQTKRVSNGFMKAITSGDATKALSYTDGDAANKAFLEEAAKTNQGSFKLEQKATKENNWYYLYSLTNADKKHGRTTIVKQNGKWQVQAYVYSAKDLKLIPDDTAAVEDTTKPAAAASTTATKSCLVAGDVTSVYDYIEQGYDDTADKTKTAYELEAQFFKPDATTYVYDTAANDLVAKTKTFYAANSTKDFMIVLQGSVKEGDASASGTKLAQDRVAKVKAALIAAGVPASRFSEKEINRYGDTDSARRVSIWIVTDKSCSS